MSQDIRSYFKVLSKKPSGAESKSSPAALKRKPVRIIDSDDDDVIPNTPDPPPKGSKKRAIILSSDSEEEVAHEKAKKPKPESKLKPVDVSDVFKKTPIQQSKVKPRPPHKPLGKAEELKQGKGKTNKNKKNMEIGSYGDPTFEQTLRDLDKSDDLLLENFDLLVEPRPQPKPVEKTEEPKKGKGKKEKNKKKKEVEIGSYGDPAFEQTLRDLDDADDLLWENVDLLDKTIDEALKADAEAQKESSESKEEKKEETKEGQKEETKEEKKEETKIEKLEETKKEKKEKTKEEKKEETKEQKKEETKEEKKEASKKEKKEKTKKEKKEETREEKKEETKEEKKEKIATSSHKEEKPKKTETADTKKRSRQESPSRATPKKQKLEHTDSGIDPGQEAHEKKRYSAMLYQKYLHRGGPKNHGQKEIPKGKPDCLNNLTFLRTGVLDSLESEEFDTLIKQHGGRTVNSVSKKVNYMVAGEEPGPKKMERATELNIPIISEDELLDLILTKSGKPAKYCGDGGKIESQTSEDQGFFSEVGSETASFTDSPKILSPARKKDDRPNLKKLVDKKDRNGVAAEDSSKRSDEKAKEGNESASKEDVKSRGSPKKQDELKKEAKDHIKVDKQEKKAIEEKKEKLVEKKADGVKSSVDKANVCLSEKYKPHDLKGIIGQQGDSSNMNKLKRWLENWAKNQTPEAKKRHIRPSPWAKNDNGAFFKAALLSGSPGVGKTTTATLVARELGLDVVEFNASDTRSKRLLHEEVSQLLSSKTIAGYAAGQATTSSKRVLLMDEVDGMAGNEDRGGVQELILLIKNSSVPIVCMCNDRNHPKIRSLANYCFDLRFSKPRVEQIRGAMMSVCFKEGLKIRPDALAEIIAGTGCDIRQTYNHLAMMAASGNTGVSLEDAEKVSKNAKKDTVLGPWEVCRMVFNESDKKNMSVSDRSRLFFYDYSIGPLFVQENYLKVQPHGNDAEALQRAAATADSISMGDLVDSKIRRTNNWSLLESQAMFSSVLPGHYMSGHFTGQINFPGWLGKNSKRTKFNRMLSEIQVHTRTCASGNKLAIKLDYLVPLRDAILMPLKKQGMGGIERAVHVMKTYNLLREDFDSLLELCQWSRRFKNPASHIESKVKAAFTRSYNKQVSLLPYAPSAGISKKKKGAAATAEDEMLLGEEEEEGAESANEEDEDVGNDAMIKVKTKTKGKEKTEPGTSSKKATKEKKEPAKKGRGKK